MEGTNDIHQEAKELLTMAVLYDPDTQSIGLRFDNAQFRNWEFVIGVLDMAKQKAEHMKRMAEIAMIQQQAQAQNLANQLRRR